VISSRGYSKQEAIKIRDELNKVGNTNYKIAGNIVAFTDDAEVRSIEKNAAPGLKGMFKDQILKQ